MERKPLPGSMMALIAGVVLCLVSLLCVAGVGTGGLSALDGLAGQGSGSQLRVQVGSAAPDFSLPTIHGGTFSLGEFRGYAILINFWATWCPPCKAEMPLLQAKYDQHFPHLVILAVEQGDGRSTVTRLAKDMGLKLTVLLDEDYAVGGMYGVRSLPTSIFVDREGIVRSIYIGEISERELDSKLALIGLE